MVNLAELLGEGTILFEGAMGTTLAQRGLPAGQPPELYTLERPDLVADIHREYVAAGAGALKTNTFNANRPRLAQAGLAERVSECNRQAVALAREVAGANRIVAGSIGPTGTLLAPAGSGVEADLDEAYVEQAALLEESGVDAFLVETMFDIREALSALRACRQASSKPVIVTMTFTKTPRGFLTLAGDGAGDALAELTDAGACAVGTNCSLDGTEIAPLAMGIRRHVSVPVLIQPRAGVHRPDSPAAFAANMARMVREGVEMIGGCCGVTPEFIKSTKQALESGQSKQDARETESE